MPASRLNRFFAKPLNAADNAGRLAGGSRAPARAAERRRSALFAVEHADLSLVNLEPPQGGGGEGVPRPPLAKRRGRDESAASGDWPLVPRLACQGRAPTRERSAEIRAPTLSSPRNRPCATRLR